MTTLVATCPACGDVSLTTDEISLQVCSRRSASFYRFECSICKQLVIKPADEQVIRTLIEAGTELQTWFYPAEWDEEHEGPPISWDDILLFHSEVEALFS